MNRPCLAHAGINDDIPLSQATPRVRLLSKIAWLGDNAAYGITDACKQLIDEVRAGAFDTPSTQGAHSMSLEAAITENTAALKSLEAAILGNRQTGALAATDKPAGKAAKDPKADAPKETPAAAQTTTATGPTFDSLKVKVLALAAKNETKAMEVMGRFGGKLPATKPEDYAKLDAELDAALAGAAPGQTAAPSLV